MERYIAKRILYGLISLWLLTVIIFVATRLSGDPASVLAEPGATREDLERIRHEYQLDRPLHVQYYTFLSKAVRADFGDSYQFKYPSMELYLMRLPNSIQLGLAGFTISLILGIPLGIVSALKVGTWVDRIASGLCILGLSLPGFWVGMLLILLFGVELGVMPTGGMGGVKHTLMPAFALGFHFTAAHMRIMRSSVLEVLGKEYIKFARIKGLPEILVVGKHCLKNAFLPVVTLAGINLVLVINITVIIETVFNWPGVGRLLFQSIVARDFPVVQTITLMSGVMMVGINLFIDILYAWVDPRIRYERPEASSG